MVTHVPIVEVALGEYTLTAVRQGAAPPTGVDGSTYIKFEVISAKTPPRIRANQAEVLTHGGLGNLKVSEPILGEDSSVDVYVRGPAPTVLKTAPLDRSNEEVYRSKGMQHFRIRYQSAVGEVTWRWVTAAGSIEIALECFPTKLDYKQDFVRIRKALQEVSPSLTTSVSGATTGLFNMSSQNDQSSDGEWLENLRSSLADMAGAVDRLLPKLRHHVASELAVVPRDRMRRARPVSRHANNTDRPKQPVQVHRLVSSAGNPVNGHLKWELTRLNFAANEIFNARWFADIDTNLSDPIKLVLKKTNEWLRILGPIPVVNHLPNLHVKLRDPLYGQAFRALHALRDSIAPLGEFRPIALKDLPTLYEYWVFLEVATILRSRYPNVRKSTAPLVQTSGPDLVLAQGRASEIILGDDLGNEVVCQYNRRFSALPTTNQRPDAVIEVASGGHVLLIDAKYRLGRDSRYLRQFNIEGPLADDINVLHRYRDAIVAPFAPHTRLSHAGLIAFPGPNEKRYQTHHFYRSWFAVRIGGVPMLPGRTSLMAQAIDDFFSDVLSRDAA